MRACIAALILALAGCASFGKNPRDPLEPMNRKVAQFNEGADAILLKPVATFYRERVPPLVRTGVSNFFNNLSDVWSAGNSLLQLRLPEAAENMLRFGVNTFFGLGGLLDIASEMNIERHREDFGQTLGRWGVPAGPYIVLPLLGPSTLRDTLALPVDRKANPVQYADSEWRNSLYALRAVDQRSNLLRVTSVLEEASLDQYSFVRDAHLQRRRAEIEERRSKPGADDNEGAEPPVPPALEPESQQPIPAAAPTR